jgi:glycosyltransferase involved in cell wall biosynthesis
MNDMLRVAVDARELLGRRTGVGRYLENLLWRWRSGGAPAELILYTPESLDLPEPAPAGAVPVVVRVIPGGRGTMWEQGRLAAAIRNDPADVLFAPGYTAPLRVAVPTVVTVHDVSFAAHPEWFSWREGARRRWLTRRSAEKAAAVVTVSAFSADEIVTHLGIPRSRIHVIPSGISALPPARGVRREPLVLFVGSIFNRRRIPDLINAFAIVAERHGSARLVLVGENRTFPPEDPELLADAHGIGDRVEWIPFARDVELADLYGRARVFAFLSDYEGFGFTPLEALAAGVPPVLADTAVARETCGEAGTYVPPGDVLAAARAIERLMTDEEARRRVLEAAPRVLARFSWDRAAEATWRVLVQAARRDA